MIPSSKFLSLGYLGSNRLTLMYVKNYIGYFFDLFLVVTMEVHKIGTSLYSGHEAFRMKNK